jgi:hypothetical protein
MIKMIDWISFFLGAGAMLAVVVVLVNISIRRSNEDIQERHQREVLDHNTRLANQRSAELERIAVALENLKK